MRHHVAFDAAVSMNGEMSALMRRHLQDYKRETQFKDHLQRHQAEQRVVVALLDRRKEPNDQQDRSGAAQNLNATRQNREGNRAIQSEKMLEAEEPSGPECGSGTSRDLVRFRG